MSDRSNKELHDEEMICAYLRQQANLRWFAHVRGFVDITSNPGSASRAIEALPAVSDLARNFEDERIEAAHHVAGHVVMFYINDWVKCGGLLHNIRVFSTEEVLADILNYCRTKRDGDVEYLRSTVATPLEAARMDLAGCLAEVLTQGVSEHMARILSAFTSVNGDELVRYQTHSADDLLSAMGNVLVTHRTNRTAADLNSFYYETISLMEANLPSVIAVAQALLSKGRLTSGEAERLCANVIPARTLRLNRHIGVNEARNQEQTED